MERLNLVLVRANARALLSRAYGVGSDIPAFIGNHVHKALKLSNIQTLCKSLAQTALNKLLNRSTVEKHRSEMLVNVFLIFAQCHIIYDQNFIDEARTHALVVLCSGRDPPMETYEQKEMSRQHQETRNRISLQKEIKVYCTQPQDTRMQW
ncbi:hypothetical protein EMCRGX_G013003 [Ephydatia muelleri]